MKLFWLQIPQVTRKFHAFTTDSGISLCRKVFMGAAYDGGNEYHENYGESSKCKSCQHSSVKVF